MLLALRISNFTVIDELEVTFGPGLTVLTGETGAGKSILVDALGLLVGGRADADSVRAGCEEATVEGLVQKSQVLADRLADLGLPDLGDEISLRRVVGRSGRGKAHVNGALVNVGVLSRLMKGLVDVAGQHEQVGLFDASQHRPLLDQLGGLGAQLQHFQEAEGKLRDVDARIDALGGDERKAEQRLDFLRFQLDELEKLAPAPGEDLALEAERRRLAGAEKLRANAIEAESLLSGQEGDAVELLGRALQLVEEGLRMDAALAPVAASLQAALVELEEATRAISRYAARVESHPQRLGEVEERLDLLKRLCRKHGSTLEGVLERQQTLTAERALLENRQERLDELLLERRGLEAEAWRRARELSAARGGAARALSRTVLEGLGQLAMPKAVFEVRVTPLDTLRAEGGDQVEFFFSANPGEPPRPLGKVASGGEASRLLLALKRGLADQDACLSYVFDEADAGVSGAVADVVGSMVREVGRRRQVLCITHLPQVAAYADCHLRVEKTQEGGRTMSRIVTLTAEERANELARMMSGVRVTPEALGAAEALLRSARPEPAPRRARLPPRGGAGHARKSA